MTYPPHPISQSPKYNLRAMFLPDMLQAQLVLSVFGDLGKKHLGQLWVHLEEKGVQHSMYVRYLHADIHQQSSCHFLSLYVVNSYYWLIDLIGILSDTWKHLIVSFKIANPLLLHIRTNCLRYAHRYVTEWLLTMYCRGFSFDLVTRVWDVFFNEGYKIVYRVALALVKVRAHVCTHDATISQQYVNIWF